jgi:hypothetical protein
MVTTNIGIVHARRRVARVSCGVGLLQKDRIYRNWAAGLKDTVSCSREVEREREERRRGSEELGCDVRTGTASSCMTPSVYRFQFKLVSESRP